ncbi:MAG TPA: immunoglobulin-like domain-containing protein [Candidatus Paceibacterota bacterium]|nr:immunoglobulin-like domain-containing protein [Candidatus Paceibacterota bacterium]
MNDIHPKKSGEPHMDAGSKAANFIKYNNTVPIILGVLFLSTSATLAASPEVRGSVYASNSQVVKVDNNRIVGVNVDTYPLSVQVTQVLEDDEYYYVRYTLTTLDVMDSIWRDVAIDNTLNVHKLALGERDLGEYVSEQLAEVRENERRRLRETQVIERKLGASNKLVATTYSGLVGRFLSPSEKEFQGYTPVVRSKGEKTVAYVDPNRLDTPATSPTYDANAKPVVKPPPQPSQPPSSSEPPPSSEPTEPTQPPSDGTGGGTTSGDTAPPEISVLGDNPARVAVGTAYTDLGVAVVDDQSETIRVEKFLNGTLVTKISINTSAPATYSITYRATDESGNTSERKRSVEVYTPSSGGGGTSSGGGGSTSTTSPTPTPTPTPTPEPEPTPEPTPTPEPEPTPAPAPEPEPEPAPEPASAPAPEPAPAPAA